MTIDAPKDVFRRVAATFDEVIDAVDAERGWDRPTPCDGWTAIDVVAHLADWTPFLLERVGRAGPDPDLPVVERWRFVAAALQSILDDPAEASTTIDVGPPGQMPVGQAIAKLVIGDVVFHTWDLARSNGIAVDLDEQVLTDQLAGMQGMEAAIRASGHFGAAVAVPADASPTDRALAFTGRDPSWSATR